MEQAVDAGAGADAAAVSADPDAGGRVDCQKEKKAASTSGIRSWKRQKERTSIFFHLKFSGATNFVKMEGTRNSPQPCRSHRYLFLLVNPKALEVEVA